MKKMIVVTMAGLILACTTAFAFQNEPEGFRGLKWGDPPTEAMRHSVSVEGNEVYVLPGDKMQLGNVYLSNVFYTFWEGQFFTGALYFNGEDNFELMKTLCEQKFGESKGYYDLFTWQGAVTTVLLSYDHFEKSGFLGIVSTLLSMEKLQRDKEAEAAKAEGDW